MLHWILIALLTTSGAFAKGKGKNQLRILTTNLENLFDTTHDEGKDDYTFLPLVVKRAMPEAMAWCEAQTGFYREECLTLDWTPSVLNQKLARIESVIRSSMAPALPDVIVVQEVENLSVLSMVARSLGPHYRAVLIDGRDERGIDTGVITRLQVRSSKLHEISTTSRRPTRGILEVKLQFGRKTVTVFTNHWPSQSNPDADRIQAGEVLLKAAEIAQENSDLIIAAGDFNTAADDVENALTSLILPHFWDAEAEARALGVDLGAAATYSYKGVWASLDHIFILKSPGVKKPDFSQVKIFSDEGRMVEHYIFDGKAQSRPRRYDPKTGMGYSDHLPLGLTIKI